MKYPIKPFAKFLYYTGAVRLYHVGTSGSRGIPEGCFLKWHPFTWLTYAAMLIPCAVVGEKISDVLPLSVRDYYKENTRWLTRKAFE